MPNAECERLRHQLPVGHGPQVGRDDGVGLPDRGELAGVHRGPLPAEELHAVGGVPDQVLSLVAPHLENANLQELHTGKVREFRITGKPKELLAQEFYAAFRPLVVTRLMPLLRPYGEIISFDITALDLPPARLRDIPNPKDS